MSKESEIFVKHANEVDDIRDQGLTTPDGIVRYDDIQYGPDPKWQVLDLYVPSNMKGPFPLIISVHGGGWVYGDKERYQYYCLSLAERGFAVINYTYRLAPAFKFPSSVIDTNLVASWVMENAREYGIDTRSIFAVGDSAGAHLLALYADILTSREYASRFPITIPSGFALRAIALNCGQYCFSTREKCDELTLALMGDLLPEGGTDEELALISPSLYVTPAFPPVFLMTSNGDFLKGQAPIFEEKLFTLGIVHELHLFGDLPHVFHLDLRCEEGIRCNDLECDFFRSFM